MKVITLESLRKYAEDKLQKPQVLFSDIVLYNKCNEGTGRFAVIADNDVTEDDLCSTDCTGVNCFIPAENIEDFGKDTPFIRSREALSGHILVNDCIPTEEELSPYLYLL